MPTTSVQTPAVAAAGAATATATGPLPIAAADRVADSAALRSKHASAGKVMALATFAMAAGSGIQALLYLRSFGIDGRTDGFFAALALYAIFGAFSQSIRVTSAPLLVGGRPQITSTQFAFALGLIALPVLVATVPLAGPLAQLLAPGLGMAARHVTETALPILGTAMILQLWAAGTATLLAVRDRFHAVAAAYAAGAVAGLSSYVALQHTAGLLTLGWSMLAMAVVTLAVMLAALGNRRQDMEVQRVVGATSPRRLAACTASILGRTGIYLAFNGLYLVTLAFAGHYRAGDATIVSYAYLFASYLVAGTGFVLGMARVADMTRGARSEWHAILAGTVPPGFRYAMLLSAPALAGLVAFGAPLVGALLPASLPPSEVADLQRFALLMAPWLVAAQLVNLLLPVMFALGRARLVNACAPLLVVLQLALTALASMLFGLDGIVAAMFLAPLGFVVFMLLAEGGGDLRRVVGELFSDGARFTLLAATSFGSAALITLVLPAGVGRALACGLIGSLGYLLGLKITAGEQLQMLLRRAPTPARAEKLSEGIVV
jgi:peptidoglycan biosynthesis protein MviN/MurJ (putative lipid II flippase)